MNKDQSNRKRPLKDELHDDELNQVTGGRLAMGGLASDTPSRMAAAGKCCQSNFSLPPPLSTVTGTLLDRAPGKRTVRA